MHVSQDEQNIQNVINDAESENTNVTNVENAKVDTLVTGASESDKPIVSAENASLENFAKDVSESVKDGIGNSGAVKEGIKEGVEKGIDTAKVVKRDTRGVSGPIDTSSLRLDADERKSVDAISDSIRAMRAEEGMPVHISDMQRNWDESAKRQALAKEAEAAETRMNELFAKRTQIDAYVSRLEEVYAQANANQSKYSEIDPVKAAEYSKLAQDIETKLKSAASARAAISDQAKVAMSQAQEVTVKLDKFDEVANKIDKAMYTGAKGAAVHMVSAMRDLANGTDNSAKYREDWERRNNPRVESAQERQTKADNKRAEQQNSELLEIMNQVNRNIETLTDEQASTNDLLSARPK